MKTSKPLRCGVLIRPHHFNKKIYAAVTLFAPFRLDDPRHLLTDMEMWVASAGVIGEQGVLDEGLPKVSGEVLAAGMCHPPDPPQAVSYVRVALTSVQGRALVDKKIAVLGDRYWKVGGSTKPTPFSEMPLLWTRAFGGPGFATNPAGRGHKPGEAGDHWLPNLEDPERLIRSASDAPRPRTFLPFDPTWPQRLSKLGTYDEKWLKDRYPGPAEDIDPTHYHLGDEDQRLPSWIEGGEKLVIENMHPQHPRIECQLPRLVGRAFIARRPNGHAMPRRGRPTPEPLEEIKTRVDTLWLLPGVMMGVLVFRGTALCLDDDLGDIEQLMVAIDDPTDLRPLAHYEAALAARLDLDEGVMFTLDDEDLLPSPALGYKVSFPEFEIEAKLKGGDHLAKNLGRGDVERRARAKAKLVELGIDPAPYGVDTPALELPEVPSYKEPKKLVAFLREQKEKLGAQRQISEEKTAALKARAHDIAREQGLDWDQMQKDAARRVGPPSVKVRARITAVLDQLEASGEEREIDVSELRRSFGDAPWIAKIEEQESKLIDGYRAGAHLLDPGALPEEEIRVARRAQVELAREAGVSLAGVDLSGADLSDLDLSGLDLSGAFLESASLKGSKLTKAKLDRAVLVRCDLTHTDLEGASLREANLGDSLLDRTSLKRADAFGAIFQRARIKGATFEECEIEDASFFEAIVEGVDFTGARGSRIIFLRLDLTGARFDRVAMPQCVFAESKLDGASFDRAKVPGMQLIATSARGLKARSAVLTGSFIGHGSDLEDADLEGADLSQSSLRTTRLVRANLRSAVLAGTDLSECDASGATFELARAPHALLMRTVLVGAKMRGANMMEAILQKANLAECDLSNTNLFRADLSRVHVSGGTKIDGSLMDFARSDPKEQA